jgi:hypothetical protein
MLVEFVRAVRGPRQRVVATTTTLVYFFFMLAGIRPSQGTPV